MFFGFLLQVLGAGGVAAFLWANVRHEGVSGHVTTVMLRLAWHGELHTKQGIAVLVVGAAVYAVGSVVAARPFVRNPWMLFVAVPIAAVIGLLILGVLALIVAGIAEGADLGGLDFGGSSRSRDRRSRSKSGSPIDR